MLLIKPINKKDFLHCTHKDFGEYMVKLVADIRRERLAYDAEWHADLETELLADGAAQNDLWGFNFYPDTDTLEYNSLINIRPKENKSSDILDDGICKRVEAVFRVWVRDE